jgi:hypothetical protein
MSRLRISAYHIGDETTMQESARPGSISPERRPTYGTLESDSKLESGMI